MPHFFITCQSLAYTLSHKVCFENFNFQILPGMRIALVGRNGCGKSTLLKIIAGLLSPSDGVVQISEDACVGYVPQMVDEFYALSGAQRFQKALNLALAKSPNVLILDEPTNHLDMHNRASFMRMLKGFEGTLILASHDTEVLRTCVDTFLMFEAGQIHVFTGAYDDFVREREIQRESIERELYQVEREKKNLHLSLMKEQERAKKSTLRGKKSIQERKWPTVTSTTKASRALETSGHLTSALRDKKQTLSEELLALRLPEVIMPKFSFNVKEMGERMVLSVREGGVGYEEVSIQNHLNFSLSTGERMAIGGRNGCGKSTVMKALLGDACVKRFGTWETPKPEDIGYLDQHYGTLKDDQTVFETIQSVMPVGTHGDIRKHLNAFLFRKNEEVLARVSTLSGGEKVRLSLAQIAARTPVLLMIDELTNNLDLETRAHVINVLKEYPGALLVISHDDAFLKAIGVEDVYVLKT